jgi:predicted  nucleic acid-binding Zn-ribbon protein/transposase-like protein
MRELNMATKHRVIKLYLEGGTFDEIAAATGISKGSVCNIIEEYKTGGLTLPPGAAVSTDEIRDLAVNLKKNDISVSQCKALMKLYVQINKLGVKAEDVEVWLGVMQEIASGSTSGSQLAQAAVELAGFTAANGKSYSEVLAEYNDKLKSCQELDAQRAGLQQDIEKLKQTYAAEKKQATADLEAITKAKATNQQAFTQQTSELKKQLDEYMQQHHLKWDKVSTVIAMANQKLAESGLTTSEIEALLGELKGFGSMSQLRKQLKNAVQKLLSETEALNNQKENLTTEVGKLSADSNKLHQEIKTKVEYLQQTCKEIETKTLCLKELQYLIDRCAHDIYAARLILSILVCPANHLTKWECEDLIRMLIGAAEIHLGAKLKTLQNADGSEDIHCLVPMIFDSSLETKVPLDEATRKMARYIVPLVKSEFVPKFVYDREQVMASFRQKSEDMQKLGVILSQKNRKT